MCPFLTASTGMRPSSEEETEVVNSHPVRCVLRVLTRSFISMTIVLLYEFANQSDLIKGMRKCRCKRSCGKVMFLHQSVGHPQADTPWKTPHPPTSTPQRRPLKQAVCILLECILAPQACTPPLGMYTPMGTHAPHRHTCPLGANAPPPQADTTRCGQ